MVNWEDEVRRVAGRTAGVRKRTLVEQDHVGPAEAGEVPDQTVADNASADDDDFGRGGEVTHVNLRKKEGMKAGDPPTSSYEK